MAATCTATTTTVAVRSHPDLTGPITTHDGCKLLLFNARRLERLRLETPQLNYALRKLRVNQPGGSVDWLLGPVSVRD